MKRRFDNEESEEENLDEKKKKLKSVVATANRDLLRIQDEKEEEEKDGDDIYKRLFEKRNNNRPLFKRQEWFPIPVEEKKVYQEVLTELPDEILSLIYQSNAPEEMGTLREKCYKESSFCQNSVLMLEKESYNENGEVVPVPFEKVECALYCLLSNLPTHVEFLVYNQNAGDQYIEQPFSMLIVIDQFNDLKDKLSKLSIVVQYDESRKKFIYTVNSHGTRKNRTSLSTLADLIYLILYYGPKSRLTFITGPVKENNSFIQSFIYKSPSSIPSSHGCFDLFLNRWNSAVKIFLITFGKSSIIQ
jgi:lipid II:glycine glycyltransferase (peptidoglycan interpeptide bridge formation enzyme)